MAIAFTFTDSTVFSVDDAEEKSFCVDATDLYAEDKDLQDINVVSELTKEIS